MLTSRLKFALLTVIFLLGYTSLSFELIVLRQLVNFVGSNTLITSVVITFILLFLSVGYYIGSIIKFSDRPIRNTMIYLIRTLIIWYILACSYDLLSNYFIVLYWLGIRSSVWIVTVFSAFFLAFPSMCLGFVTSAIGRIIHRSDSNYTGRFMAVDTIGSVFGSLCTTLVFMPLIGVSATVIVLIVLTAAADLLLERRKDFKQALILILIFIVLGAFVNNDKFMTPHRKLIKDDAVSRVEIEDINWIDDNQPTTIMKINGSYSSLISADKNIQFPYVKFINETFINNLPKDRKHDILILGAGGFTMGIQDTFNNYIFLDIDKDLQQISENHFLHEPLPANKKFITQDAYLFMLNTKDDYDMIIVDIYLAVRGIPTNFVTENFFSMVKRHLKPNGIMIANIITSPSFTNNFAKRIDNTLRTVFPQYLDRHVLQPYNPFANELVNIEYIYYNYPPDNTIYTSNKNSAVYGQE